MVPFRVSALHSDITAPIESATAIAAADVGIGDALGGTTSTVIGYDVRSLPAASCPEIRNEAKDQQHQHDTAYPQEDLSHGPGT